MFHKILTTLVFIFYVGKMKVVTSN